MALGITGFFPNASYLEGGLDHQATGVMRPGRWRCCSLALAGLVRAARLARPARFSPPPGGRSCIGCYALLLLWAGLHLTLYVALGVT